MHYAPQHFDGGALCFAKVWPLNRKLCLRTYRTSRGTENDYSNKQYDRADGDPRVEEVPCSWYRQDRASTIEIATTSTLPLPNIYGFEYKFLSEQSRVSRLVRQRV